MTGAPDDIELYSTGAFSYLNPSESVLGMGIGGDQPTFDQGAGAVIPPSSLIK